MSTITNPQKVFVDTSSFVALQDDRDSNHKKAVSLAKILHAQKAQLYTSSDVIGEALTVIARKLGKKAALVYYKNYIKSGVIEVFIDKYLHEETREFFLQLKQKNISFIDCSSVVAMKKEKINTIFTFDGDFKVLGVELFGEK